MMKKSKLAIACLSTLFAGASPAVAATNVIDINQPEWNIYLADFAHPAGLGQTFQQVTDNISGAGCSSCPAWDGHRQHHDQHARQ